MAFTQEEENILRARAMLLDTGDGLGTFTGEEIAKLKDIIATVDAHKEAELKRAAGELATRFCKLCTVCSNRIPSPGPDTCPHHSVTEPETPARWIPPCTAAPTPDWQPADITAETLTPVPGQGSKL